MASDADELNFDGIVCLKSEVLNLAKTYNFNTEAKIRGLCPRPKIYIFKVAWLSLGKC